MASDLEFMQYVVDQIDADCDVTFRRMFGEFGVYSRGKFFGQVCDNRFFVKPTAGGRAFIGTPVEAQPYPGARNAFLVGDKIEDGAWVSELIRITARELPSPKPKNPSKRR